MQAQSRERSHSRANLGAFGPGSSVVVDHVTAVGGACGGIIGRDRSQPGMDAGARSCAGGVFAAIIFLIDLADRAVQRVHHLAEARVECDT